MFKIDIDTKQLTRRLSDIEKRQLPFATAGALNDAMFDVRNAWRDAMPQVFDQPTQLTRNAVLYKKATKRNLVAEVFLRNEASKGTPPSRYLVTQVTGGRRAEKPFEFLLRRARVIADDEFVVPAKGFPLDTYGNIPGGVVNKILADLQATREVAARSTAETRARRARSRSFSKRAVYFLAHPSRPRANGAPQHLPPGIYQRTQFASGSSIRMVLAIVRQPRYTTRFDAQALAQRAFNASFPNRFRQRMIEAVRTARK